MLQVIIMKKANDKADGISYIEEIRDLETMSTVSKFDENARKIDLICLKDKAGQKILVSHFIKENDSIRFDYEGEKTLIEMDVDENGLQFIRYE